MDFKDGLMTVFDHRFDTFEATKLVNFASQQAIDRNSQSLLQSNHSSPTI